MTAPALPTTAAGLVDLLRAEYSLARGWVFVEQVPPNTGFTDRYADAVAVHLHRAERRQREHRDPALRHRDREVWGFEVKVSRGDWRRELADPAKAEAVARHCDRWWVVAPAGVVRSEELPAGWGLLVPRLWRKGEASPHGVMTADVVELETVVRAGLRPTAGEGIDRAFAAALLKRTAEQWTAFGKLDRQRDTALRRVETACERVLATLRGCRYTGDGARLRAESLEQVRAAYRESEAELRRLLEEVRAGGAPADACEALR